MVAEVVVSDTMQLQKVWTFADLQALPEHVDWRCYEIVDGALVVSPSTDFRHEAASSLLRQLLYVAGMPDFIAVGPMGVDLHPTYRMPDLIVVSGSLIGRRINPMPASEVLLAVEVMSPGSVTTDRVTKPAQYAAIGIPNYWRVETDPIVRLSAYHLEDGADVYTGIGTWTSGQTAHLSEPFRIDIAIDAILPPAQPDDG